MTLRTNFFSFHARAKDYCCRKKNKVCMKSCLTFSEKKCKIETFGHKLFQDFFFIQTTVYILSVCCFVLEKQLVFQFFKNG